MQPVFFARQAAIAKCRNMPRDRHNTIIGGFQHARVDADHHTENTLPRYARMNRDYIADDEFHVFTTPNRSKHKTTQQVKSDMLPGLKAEGSEGQH
jgi:hypothetical protein